jgi:hypothetical protein
MELIGMFFAMYFSEGSGFRHSLPSLVLLSQAFKGESSGFHPAGFRLSRLVD